MLAILGTLSALIGIICILLAAIAIYEGHSFKIAWAFFGIGLVFYYPGAFIAKHYKDTYNQRLEAICKERGLYATDWQVCRDANGWVQFTSY